MVHAVAEAVAVQREIVVDEGGRAGLRLDVGQARLACDPGVEDGEVFANDGAVSRQKLVGVKQGDGREGLVEEAAADEVIASEKTSTPVPVSDKASVSDTLGILILRPSVSSAA